MTRIVSYNMLAGGYSLREEGARRTKQITAMIRSVQPDIVGLVEAMHPQMRQKPLVVEEIADNLGMQLIKGGEPTRPQDYQLALLTRLPVVYSKIHASPGRLLRPLLEVCVEETDGQQLTVFVAHLSAAFNQGRGGGHIRMCEVQEILCFMAPLRAAGKPHLIMGDFNSLAPGDAFTASSLLRYVVQMDKKRPARALNDGNPYLDSVVPPRLRFLKPALRLIASSDFLCSLFDAVAYFYAPRGCIRLLQNAGYVDSYRHEHPADAGFTCPAAAPAGRIDYIFADPVQAQRLTACEVITAGEGVVGREASDHLPLTAEFGLSVGPTLPSTELDDAVAR